MTSPINSATSTTTPSLTAAAGGSTSQPLDRQAFLKLLVAQISHQDPLQPMQGTEFVSQLSQFAMVEQSIAQSTSLQTLSTQIGGVANNEATGLVGKTVTMRGHALAYDGSTAATTSFTLPKDAAKLTADVVDADGKVVRTIDIGAHAAGAVALTWDGKDSSGNPAAKGNYSLKVHASAADGTAIETAQDVVGTVMKVSFDKGYAELTLDNGAVGPISDLTGVQQKPVTTK